MSEYLRELKEKDAEHMLEWMCDSEITQMFQFNVANIDIKRIHDFINDSMSNKTTRHYAIVDDKDEYMGTISLKDIDEKAKKAEYAIVLRKCAQGKGLAKKATIELLTLAFQELGLQRVYLNVFSTNTHAIRFYRNLGFIQEGEFKNHIYAKGKMYSILWFRMMKEEYLNYWGNDGKNNREN